MTNPDGGLVARGVTKRYTVGGETLTVLDGVDLRVPPGGSVAVTGRSGSGKSTLLHCLGGLDTPDAGEITVDGRPVPGIGSGNDADAAAFRNRTIGFVFQDHHLIPHLSAIDNVLIPTLAAGRSTADQVSHAGELLDRVGLDGRHRSRVTELSGGQRERVAIARALVMRPALVLADEPTGNLDRDTADAVADLLVGVVTSGGGMLVTVTHDDALAGRMDQRLHLGR